MSGKLRLIVVNPKNPTTNTPKTSHNIDNIDNYEETQFGNEYTSKEGYILPNKQKSIIPYLKKFNIPENIMSIADDIHNKMKQIVRRKNKHNLLLYYCTYCAYLEYFYEEEKLIKQGIIPDIKGYIDGFDPGQLGEKFGLTYNELQKADSLFSPLQTGYSPPSTYISLFNYLPNYCKCINLSNESIIEVIELAKDIMSKNPKLKRENTRSTAAGIVYYFTVINGITITNIEQFENLVRYKFSTINTVYEKISVLDNS
jgi:hypothetical protein